MGRWSRQGGLGVVLVLTYANSGQTQTISTNSGDTLIRRQPVVGGVVTFV